MEQNLQPASMEREMHLPGRIFWPGWSQTLRRWGLGDLMAVFLEAAGPFNLLLAQLVYLGQPFLQPSSGQAFARMLEDQHEAQAFASFLRQEESR